VVHAAHQQTHNVRLGTHVGVRHDGVLGREQDQYGYQCGFDPVEFFGKLISVNYRHKIEAQSGQLIRHRIDAKYFKTKCRHPEGEMGFIEPIHTLEHQVAIVTTFDHVTGYQAVQAGVVGKKSGSDAGDVDQDAQYQNQQKRPVMCR